MEKKDMSVQRLVMVCPAEDIVVEGEVNRELYTVEEEEEEGEVKKTNP